MILTFLPINFPHPVRRPALRPFEPRRSSLLWSALGAYSLLKHFDMPQWAVVLFIVSGIYLYVIGAVLQLFPALGRK